MGSTTYVALLRGINVGGRNIIKMAELKACFEELGCLDVASYIQSGNILFRSDGTPSLRLVETIEQAIAVRFRYQARIVLLSHSQLHRIVEAAPHGFGGSPDQYKYDVIFLRKPLSSAQAMRTLSIRPGVDTAWAGPGTVYFARNIARISQSRLSKIVAHPAYGSMTIRNWNTTTRLLKLSDEIRRANDP